MSRHILTVEPDGTTWSIGCPDSNGCEGWQECDRPHEVAGVSAADGPYDCNEGDPWDGHDEFDFHGVNHEWRSGYGWTVAYPGCILTFGVVDPPDDLWDRSEERWLTGRWIVDDDWDDTDCFLYLIGPADGEAAS